MKPTDYLDVWSDRDRGLAEALLLHEDNQCPGCGHDREHAWDERSEGEYEAEPHTCQACRARELAQDEVKGREKKPGQHLTVRRIPGQGPPLPD